MKRGRPSHDYRGAGGGEGEGGGRKGERAKESCRLNPVTNDKPPRRSANVLAARIEITSHESQVIISLRPLADSRGDTAHGRHFSPQSCFHIGASLLRRVRTYAGAIQGGEIVTG